MPTYSLVCAFTIASAVLLFPCATEAQEIRSGPAAASSPVTDQQPPNVPPAVRQIEEDVEEAVRRFRIGVKGGVGFDPELIMFGAFGAFGPIFHRSIEFRPGIELGLGELTTLLGVNLDVLYTLPGMTRQTRWVPYIGAGPTFGLSHRGFETEDTDNVNVNGAPSERNRFDFGDTDFNGGMNFITGARNQSGLFFELKATAWGVSNIRLLAGFNF